MPAEYTECFIHLNGLRLHYLDWGNTSAPPLLLIHGLRLERHVGKLARAVLSGRGGSNPARLPGV